jgi:molybdopterin-containing oxidoreductase family iron-sulfur binding subunit
MAACPYHARSFNWWDPEWPGELAQTLNPDVSTRTRGVVEKCSFCSHRLLAARARQAALAAPAEAGSSPDAAAEPEYTPACLEACPSQAIAFGNLADDGSEVARQSKGPYAFRLLERLGTDPKVFYRTERPWVRAAAEGRQIKEGVSRG